MALVVISVLLLPPLAVGDDVAQVGNPAALVTTPCLLDA